MTTNGSTSTGGEPLSRYFQAVNASYDALVAAAESGSKHGNAVWSRVLEDSRAAQKEALGLSEQVLGKPADAQTYSALLESTQKSQERALGFAKVLFDEVSGSTVDAHSALEGVMAANRTAAEAAAEVARTWTGDSTFADAWRKSVEAMNASPSPRPS